MSFTTIVDLLVKTFELGGIAALLVGTLVALSAYARRVIAHPGERGNAYNRLRQGLGQAILVGLELLIAGDIIRTITIEPTFQSVAVLGLIVLIRTFLSWSLEVEINGEWPWQRTQSQAAHARRPLDEDEP